MGITTYRPAKTPFGKGAVRITTEVEVESYADVDVTIPIADIIDDIIDALDQDQAEIVAAKAGMVNKAQLEGENLKRHLCDLAGVSYQCDIDRIINALIDRL